jgi:hypothetical protein
MSSSPDELNLNRKPRVKSVEVIPAGESVNASDGNYCEYMRKVALVILRC